MPCIAVGCEEDLDPEPGTWNCSVSASSGPPLGLAASPGEKKEHVEEIAPGMARWSLSFGDDEPSEPAPPAQRSVLFLDIDGVLNTRPDPRQLHLEERPCRLLRGLLEKSGAELVLSSPWRRHHGYVLEVLVKFGVFKEGAEPEELPRTPSHASENRRDLEILQWLGSRRGSVGAWVALDGADLLQRPSAARLRGHVVRTEAGQGLSEANVGEALRLLGEAAAPPVKSTSPSADAGEMPRGAAAKEVRMPVQYASTGCSTQAPAEAAPPPKAEAEGLTDAFRGVGSWDCELEEKMRALLGALAPSQPDPAAKAPVGGGRGARGDGGREFEELAALARGQFGAG